MQMRFYARIDVLQINHCLFFHFNRNVGMQDRNSFQHDFFILLTLIVKYSYIVILYPTNYLEKNFALIKIEKKDH